MGAPERGEFAAVLRRLREAAALTQEELAERAALTSNAIGALERGERRRPYPHTVRALADALGADDADRAALIAAARPVARPSGRPAFPVEPVTPASSQPPGALVGRERELEELVAAVQRDGARLVTVTGPGGVGKTRLALAAGERLTAGWTVAVAELAAVSDVRLVLVTAARALGLRHGEPDEVLDLLPAHLGDRPHLLVLDNVEHLLAASPLIAELLTRCGSLRVLATSRAPLRIRAEQEYPLDPLALAAGIDLPAIAGAPAVQMFLDRARAVAPGFALSTANAVDVAEICRRLDGLPLALELAAAHARLLDPGALLERLGQALARPRSRDLPARQATMRATIDWSHDLLTAAEQAVLRRASVFSGHFGLDAVEAVAGDEVDAFDAVAGLVEQSLVMPVAGSAYRMLEPVRQYAAARLVEAGEADELARRHARFYRALGVRARPGLHSADQREWLELLAAEHGNLRAALTTLLATQQFAAAGDLLADTWLYWALRGLTGEGLEWAERILARTDSAPGRVALAGLRFASGDLAGLAEAVAGALSTMADDDPRRVEALVLAGSGAAFRGEATEAATLLGTALDLARRRDDGWGLAHALVAQALLQAGGLDVGEASRTAAAAEQAARELGCPFTLATALNTRASLALMLGDDALDLLVEAADLAVTVGTTWSLVYSLSGLAVVAAGRERWTEAAALLGAADATASAASLAVSFPPDRAAAERAADDARSHLDPDGFERAWDRGRTMTGAEAVATAVELRTSSARG